MTWSWHSAPCTGLRTTGPRPRWTAFAAVAALVVVGCDSSEPIEVPVESIPLGPAGGQCVDQLKVRMPGGAACLYFDNTSCVLVADLAAISTDGCDSNGACRISRGAWMKYCPDNDSDSALQIEVGQRLGAALFVLESGAGSARPDFCSFPRPAAACNASLRDGEGDGGCLARLDLGYQVQDGGVLMPTGDAALSASGFFLDALDLTGEQRLCPTVGREECPAESCTAVDVEVRLSGNGAGDVVLLPDDIRCLSPGCVQTVPNGRVLELLFSAQNGAVVGSVASALGAEGTCNQRFDPPAATATCSITMRGSGQVTATFGFPLDVVVAGLGQVTVSPGGIGSSPVDCSSNTTCTHVYDGAVDVTLTAVETMSGWQFTQWSGGPCDGSESSTCVVRTDQARRVAALFGVALELVVNGDGSIIATPPGLRCTGPQSCLTAYPRGEQISLSYEVGANSVFAEWAADCASFGSGPQCSLMMNVERRAVATFGYEVRHASVGGGTVTRVTSGLACDPEPPETCAAFRPGEVASFTAEAAAAWAFLGWQDCGGAGSALACDLTVTQSVDVVGMFGRPLTLLVNGGGSVALSPGAAGGCDALTRTNCTGVFADGQEVVLTAMPDADWAFDEVTGCAAVAGQPNQCRVSMSQPQTVNFVFGREIQVDVSGNGRVTSGPANIDCGTNCRSVVDDGLRIRLVAEPDPDWGLVSWTGCTPVDGSDPPACDVTMNGRRTVDVVFGRELSVGVTGEGVVRSMPAGIDCSSGGGAGCRQVFAIGDQVTLTAVPTMNWGVLSWSGCAPDPVNSRQCTLTVDQASAVTLEFGRELLVSTEGQGTVTTVAPAVGIRCGSGGDDCVEVYRAGQTVELTANPDPNWSLVRYSGCSSETNGNCSVVMGGPQPLIVVATFGRSLGVSIQGQGSVRSDPPGIDCSAGNNGTCNAPFGPTEQVVLTASPQSGAWTFRDWGENGTCPQPDGSRCRLVVDRPRSVRARFRQIDGSSGNQSGWTAGASGPARAGTR